MMVMEFYSASIEINALVSFVRMPLFCDHLEFCENFVIFFKSKESTFENYTEHGPCLLDIHITCTIANENFTHPIFRESAQI